MKRIAGDFGGEQDRTPPNTRSSHSFLPIAVKDITHREQHRPEGERIAYGILPEEVNGIQEQPPQYVHGHSVKESGRLKDQAAALCGLLHCDTHYPPGSCVLEAGCGVGAQTLILAGSNPDTRIISIDIAEDSLRTAQRTLNGAGLSNVDFIRADIFDLPFGERAFDHIFVCFVLEHLKEPAEALRNLYRILKPGGTVTIIEGDHGSAFYHPLSSHAARTIQCLVDIQGAMGGNALIGRQLYPLIRHAGFRNVQVSPRMVYVDAASPDLVEGFTKQTFIAMVEGVREQALASGMISEAEWDQGIRDLHRTTGEDGTFCYTFFKGTGVK